MTASKSRYFVWTEDHDILMLREAVTSEPYNFKPKSSERGKVWESIATHLNSLKTPEFRVTARAVRDRYALLISRHNLKQREEEKASGIDVPELTELGAFILEEIREREQIAEERTDALRTEKKAKDEKEKAAAEEIRQAALKTMTKRKSDDSGEKPAIEFLTERSEKERELKKEELAIKKRELDLAETRREEAAQQQQTMFSALMNQMQQQQQLQQQNLQIMLNQQNKVFMALLENMKKH